MLVHPLVTICLTALLCICVKAQSTLPPPSQPAKSGTPGQFEIITQSLVSAQQVNNTLHLRVYIYINHALDVSRNFEFHLFYRQSRK